MSGIVGVWNLDGRPVEPAELAAMSAMLAHRGPDGSAEWIQGSVGLACRLLRVTPEASAEVQPLVHPSGSVLVFDGRLDNREELLANLDTAPGITGQSPDPALVLAGYETFGEGFAERLTGDFALGLFDHQRGQLLLARDAIGVRPLYYARAGNTFLFASEIKALLAHPDVSVRPDDDHLAQFLLCGSPHNREGRTFFSGVSSLLPAHMAILTRERFLRRRYWDFDPARRVRLGSFGEYAEAFREHFERAVRRRLRSAYPVAVSVSGGLDSSSVLCLAQTLGRRGSARCPRVLGVSYVFPDGSPADETAFLLEIEREYGIEITRVRTGAAGFMEGSREEVWHIEAPWLEERWDGLRTFLRVVRRLGSRVVVTGHWGDQILFPEAYLIDLVRSLAWREAWAHLREFGRWFTDVDPRHFRRRFFLNLIKYHVPPVLAPYLRRLRASLGRTRKARPWYTDGFQKRVGCSIREEIAAGQVCATAHARSLYEEVRSRQASLCLEWSDKVAAMHGLEMAYPFLDRDVVAFLMAIPGEIQTWKGVPKALLREGMRGVLPEAISRRTWKADFTHLVNAAVERDFPRLANYLGPDSMAVQWGYLKHEVIENELERLRDGLHSATCAIAWSLSDLVGLELWLRVFFGENGGSESSPSAAGEAETIVLGGTR